ncbi:MAG: DUF1266 domain-containing protein [Lachnospiraceae bacterium]|nr:DUF1266 domain-containing protein [Parablautia intestinalis]MDE7046562.1 DUF1266 domain-containing protein [Lachnospiraceae bacterium]
MNTEAFVSGINWKNGGMAEMGRICRTRIILLVLVMVLSVMSAGCGTQPSGASASFKKKTNMSNKDSALDTEPSEDFKGSADSKDEESPFVYLEKKEIEDINEPGAVYEIYMPKDAEVTSGFASLNQHGISYSADVYGYGEAAERYASFEDHLTLKQKYAHEADSDYIDVADTGIIENGEDRYFIFTGRGVDYDGVSFELRQLYYLEMQPSGAGILWNAIVYEDYADEDTEPLIDELAACHGINLDLIKPGSSWEVNMDQDTYQAREGDKALEDVEGYAYMGLTSISDYYREAHCSLMLPKARIADIDRTSAYSFLHGVLISADVSEIYSGNALVTEMKSSADIKYETALHNTQTIRNVQRSAMLPVPGFENALQMAISYEKKGYQSEEYLPRVEALCYIPIDDTFYLALEIFLSYEQWDPSTDAVIAELETAYGIDLFKYCGGPKEPEVSDSKQESTDAGKAAPITMAMLMGGNEGTSAPPSLPDTVLWFNATYAPLTYSNGFNWRLVGGLKITEENKELTDWGLQNSWNITDRESALEAAERLKQQGHRQTCQEYMDELKEMGLLDLEEKEFRKKFLQTKLSSDYRYVIAYNMYQEGLDADYMAAWDLCRVNQLYADFYILGYMTYEEAMDASLENSLVLQKLYSSWEEMVDGYMLGFQFWSRDSASKEDSPTKERYRYYEMLKGSDDSPYELDWNMELTKSW